MSRLQSSHGLPNGDRSSISPRTATRVVLFAAASCLALTGCDGDRILAPRPSASNQTPSASLQLAAALADVRVSFKGEVVPVEPDARNYDYTMPTVPLCYVRLTRTDYYGGTRCGEPLAVPPGDYAFTVTWHGIELANEFVTLQAGSSLTRVIELGDRAARVTGRLTQNQQPAPGHYTCSIDYCTTADADGRFNFLVLPVAGYVNARAYDAPAPGKTVDLGDVDEQVGFVRFDLVHAGQPVTTDYNSCGVYSQIDQYHQAFSVPCGALTAVSPSTGTLDWHWLGQRLLTEPFTIAAGQTVTRALDITDKASLVTGTLTFNGKPATSNGFFIEGGYQIAVHTDAAGRFSVVVPRGAPNLIIGSFGLTYSKVIDASQQTTDLGVVDFSLPSVRALVRYGSGVLPSCRMRIWFLDASGVSEWDCDGASVALPPGRYRLTAEYAGVVLGEKTAMLAAGESLELDLDAAPMLGRVTGNLLVSGRPMPAGRYVCVLPSQYTGACTMTDAAGHFDLAVPPGTGELLVDRFKVPYTVAAGETIDISGAPPGDTPFGRGVSIAPVDPTTGLSPATITFGNVLTPGITTVTTATLGNGLIPSPQGLFVVGGSRVYLDINTSATFDGMIKVCLNYGQLATTGNPKTFRLLHYDASTGRWSNITTSNDVVAKVICGDTPSLSPFTVAQATPVIAAPASLEVSTDRGVCRATIDVGVATATTDGDLDSVVGVRADALALSAPYPRGPTLVRWTATDGDGLTATAEQSVTVIDREPPALTVPGSLTANTDPGKSTATVNVGTATATDNCGTASVSARRGDGAALSDPWPAGATTITWMAVDEADNVARLTETVTVRDAESPVITMPADMVVNATMPTGATVSFAPTATDNVGVVSTTCERASASVFPIGVSVVSCVARDAAANMASGVFRVTVMGAPEQITNLIEFISGTAIPATPRLQLVSLLEKALANPRNTRVSCPALSLLMTTVKVHTGPLIPADKAARVIADATRIKAVVGCS